MNRKDFLKLSSASVFLAGLKSHGINPSDLNYNYLENNSQYMGDFIAPKLDVIKIAFIGVGARGSGHAKQIAAIEGTEVVAISDLYEDLAKKSYEICKEIGNNERHRN
ncbi:MAG: alpha-N-acetylgalactosaminidase, partial [Flavobacteriaceae bacterium]